ncbi:MAG TPA: carbohydrate ABC transporter permease [Gaiellaceae bacterium]|nr:carbohydrate ABC transporter permease [Gaiellaceae bacterium]
MTPDRATVLKPAGRVLAILLIGAFFLFPLYWLVTMSFKPQDEWSPVGGKIFWTPGRWTLDNFTQALGISTPNTQFFSAAPVNAKSPIIHSLVTATGGTLVALVIGVLAAYGIARFRAGGKMLPFQILQLRMFPPIVVIIPLLIMFAWLGRHTGGTFGVDTYWALILVYGAVTFPFVVWLMRSFFQEVPREIAEAAIVDGCTQWGAFFKAILPQVRGGLAATALFVFILNWSDFLIALVLTDHKVVTAPVFLNSLQSAGAGQEYGPQAALGLVLIVPPAVFGLLIQRYLVRGLTFGAIKR